VRDITYPPIIVAAKLGFRVLGNRFQMTGTEHVPRTGGVLLAFNHIGYVDFIYGGFAAHPSRRLVRFMSKKELFDHRYAGPLMRSLHHIEVDRGAGTRSLEVAQEYLEAGEAVGIFPEATISRALELKEFKTGSVRIAAAAGVPVVPVVLWGTQRLKTKDHPRDFSRGKTISITVGQPRHYPGTDPAAETADLHAVMSQMLDRAIRAYPADEQPPGSWWLPARYGGSAPTLEQAAALDEQEKVERARRRAERRGEPDPDPT
jgi:1-acyl-sn-glycerol-3-phosphate acyltransferase